MPKRKYTQDTSEPSSLHSSSHPRQPQETTTTIKTEPIIPKKNNRTKLVDKLYEAINNEKIGNYAKGRRRWIKAANRVRTRVMSLDGSCAEVEHKDDGLLPLHLAIGQGAPYIVIRAMVEVYPKGCEVPFDVSPLHLSCAYPRKKVLESWKQKAFDLEDDPDAESIIRLLMKTYPKAIRLEGENKGRTTPLHLILEHKPSEELVRTMVKHYKRVTNDDANKSIFHVKDGQGQLPLHIALENQSSVDVVRFILKGYPGATKYPRKYHDGCLALHCAVLFENSKDCLTEIMESFPGALALCNDNTEIPLHMLFVSGNEERWSLKNKSSDSLGRGQLSEKEICKLLLRIYSKYQTNKVAAVKALFQKRDRWGRTVLESAKECKTVNSVPDDLISFLEKAESGDLSQFTNENNLRANKKVSKKVAERNRVKKRSRQLVPKKGSLAAKAGHSSRLEGELSSEEEFELE